jgi:hypothetical protein
MAFGPPTPASYLAGLDAHLATIDDVGRRSVLLEEEIRRVDRAERELDRWARAGGGRPTPFDGDELSIIALALSKRLADARDEERASNEMKAAAE